jgi:hypothetical protein
MAGKQLTVAALVLVTLAGWGGSAPPSDAGFAAGSGEAGIGTDMGTAAGTVTGRVRPRVPFALTKAEWEAEKAQLQVEGTAPPGTQVTVANATSLVTLGLTSAGSDGRWRLEVRDPRPVPCRVRATAGERWSERAVDHAPATCDGSGGGLSALAVLGPATVAEGHTATYTARATFTDGSTQDVTALAVWSVNSPHATISGGVLTAGEVAADETVLVSASYTRGSETRSAATTVTILDQVPVSGSHAGRFAVYEGTKTCLTCHLSEAMAMHASVHYQWQGNASEAVGLSSSLVGKLGGINDFCIYPDINWLGKLVNLDGQQVDGGCARCHSGLGAKPAPEPTQAQLENIDCLLCHSKNYRRTVAQVDGAWRFVPDTAAMSVSLQQAAVDITKPDSATCLNCHTKAGGGNNYKRGDLEEAHRTPSASFDVHMAPRAAGGAGLSCLSCHTAAAHHIAGRGTDLRERDLADPVRCTNCHSRSPHKDSKLNSHTARVSCTVCHIPEFAKVAPTDLHRDYSASAEVVAATRLYEPHMLLASHVQPEYRFFNGTSQFYEFGSEAVPDSSGRIVMSKPLGSITDPPAQIVALKRHTARQPIDPVTRRLLPLKMSTFFQTGDVTAAVRQGVAAVGWPDNGFEFAETERWMGLYHEVAPAKQALQCSACHGGTRMDFAALGYTPLATRNGKPLCSSCHGAKTASFTKIHEEHVTEKHYDCSTCHTFSKAQ